MTEFLTKKKKENEKSPFAVWVRKYGNAVASDIAPDNSATVKRKSEPTYGATAERLFDLGLQKSGYAGYLQSEAERGFRIAKDAFHKESAAVGEKNRSGYARYLTSYEKRQDDLRKSMINRIGNGESFDENLAYENAIAAVLNDENAREAARLGVTSAKERATAKLLRMILEKRLRASRVKEYARLMGFTEEEVNTFSDYADQINSIYAPSRLPEDLFNNQ